MKIYLLDRNYAMIREWEKWFYDIKDIEIVHDDFEKFMNNHTVQCVVSPANSFGLMDGGYDLAISKWFGFEMMKKVQQYIIDHYFGEQPVGTSFIVDTGVKDIKLIHTPTMREPETIKDPLIIYQCMRTTLIEAIKNNIQSIVIPAFGGGCGGIRFEMIAYMMFQGYKQVMENNIFEITWENHMGNRQIMGYDGVDNSLNYIEKEVQVARVPKNDDSDIDKIIRIVAEEMGVSSESIISRDKTTNIRIARMMAMYICRDYLNITLVKIGNAFGGREHPSVIMYLREFEKLYMNSERKHAIRRSMRYLFGMTYF